LGVVEGCGVERRPYDVGVKPPGGHIVLTSYWLVRGSESGLLRAGPLPGCGEYCGPLARRAGASPARPLERPHGHSVGDGASYE